MGNGIQVDEDGFGEKFENLLYDNLCELLFSKNADGTVAVLEEECC